MMTKKDYCLNLLNTYLCIKGVVQYYCSSTIFFNFSLLCRREFNNILVFLFVCTTI